ncbi:hypothetical protein Tco_0951971 [Tanacetum coccineum]|uniref:Uncharacterized protein n=1 Tax=Tanacetum coccineum TaxID=301880 RepID=A0ABQ5DVK5_9ASTR
MYLDDEFVVMTRNYFLQYTQLSIPEFRDTLIQHVESVKKSIDKRALHKREYDTKVNERQIQITEDKVDRSNSSGLLEKGFAIAALKNELRKLTGNSVNTKFVKSSILGKPVLQPHRNQSVVRQLTASKSERPRTLKPRFAAQVDVNNNLSKPVTTHYLPKERESTINKPHHVIACSKSRNSLKNIPRFSSNDMVHNHYLEEAKKKTQDEVRNSRPSVIANQNLESITKSLGIGLHLRVVV